MNNIIFVTSNDNKLREAETALGIKLERQKIELEEIQSMNLEQITRYKLEQAYQQLKRPVIVEDAGLYIESWNGFPGPFIKWLADTMGYDILPKTLHGQSRKARWRVIYGYTDGSEVIVRTGVVDGTIAEERRDGQDGWGFDPIFIPDGETETFAEMGVERKMQYSARRKAIQALRDALFEKESE